MDLNDKEMNLLLEKLKADSLELLNNSSISWNEGQNLGKAMGVYAILDEHKKWIYIGSTNKFKVRFTDMLYSSTHTLHKKLMIQLKNRDKVISFLKNECAYKVKICQNKRYAECLEHFLIELLNPPQAVRYRKQIKMN